MRIKKKAAAGTQEKGDIRISLTPIEEDTRICLTSTMAGLFDEQITACIGAHLAQLSVDHVLVEAEDKGAFDFVIRARVEAAVSRAMEGEV